MRIEIKVPPLSEIYTVDLSQIKDEDGQIYGPLILNKKDALELVKFLKETTDDWVRSYILQKTFGRKGNNYANQKHFIKIAQIIGKIYEENTRDFIAAEFMWYLAGENLDFDRDKFKEEIDKTAKDVIGKRKS